jgi:spore germination cell wall hydrolase CwlJ-like protein
MLGFLRAGGVAAALTMLATFAAPAMAEDSQIPVAAVKAEVAAAPVAQLPQVTAPLAAPAAQAPAPAPQAATAPKPRPLRDLVISFVDYGNQDAEQDCLAKAVYFEARGESLEGQLAVAEVILNRAASGVYPSTICGVVTQPAQFSFIRGGKFPALDKKNPLWHRSQAIAEIARKRLATQIAPNVLWYHANYVAPSWGRRLTRFAQIGTHIFYS